MVRDRRVEFGERRQPPLGELVGAEAADGGDEAGRARRRVRARRQAGRLGRVQRLHVGDGIGVLERHVMTRPVTHQHDVVVAVDETRHGLPSPPSPIRSTAFAGGHIHIRSTLSAHSLACGRWIRGRGKLVAASEVGGDDPRAAAHILRRTVGDHASELQHHHAVADIQHEPHVVVDQQRGLPLVGQSAQAPAEVLTLPGVEAGGDRQLPG